MLISADLIIQAVFISAIFLSAISIPKQLYYILYFRHSLSSIWHADRIARKLYEKGTFTKEDYEEFLEYYQAPTTKMRQLIAEMEAWDTLVKSMHEPMVESITSFVLIFAILLIPENFISSQITPILLLLLIVQAVLLITAAMSISLRKMEKNLDKHFREAMEVSRKIEIKNEKEKDSG